MTFLTAIGAFLITFIPRAVAQGIPLLFGSTGETITEKSGHLNLGIPGIMYVGAIGGVIGAFFYEQHLRVTGTDPNAFLIIFIPLMSCLIGSLLMGLIYSVLTTLVSRTGSLIILILLGIQMVLIIK